jgi:hypothetical protein
MTAAALLLSSAYGAARFVASRQRAQGFPRQRDRAVMATALHYVKDPPPAGGTAPGAGRARLDQRHRLRGRVWQTPQFSREYGRKSGVPSGQDLMAAGRAERPHRSQSEIIRKLH